MPSVQVKEFPQGLYDELKAYAETQHRSMSQQLIVAAEQMMNRVSAADADSPGGAFAYAVSVYLSPWTADDFEVFQ